MSLYVTYTLARGKLNDYWQQTDHFRTRADAVACQQEWEYVYGVACRVAHIH